MPILILVYILFISKKSDCLPACIHKKIPIKTILLCITNLTLAVVGVAENKGLSGVAGDGVVMWIMAWQQGSA